MLKERSGEYLIEIKQIEKIYSSQKVLENLNFKVRNREFLALLGESGCGKTTLLKIITGFEIPDCGEIKVNGQIFNGKDTFIKPEKRKIGIIFQDYALFPHLTVAENITFGMQGSNREQKKKRLDELLELTDLRGQENKLPEFLSGGQQQRTALARTLAPKPDIILMDEPFSNLDYHLRINIREEIRSILSSQGVTVVLVTHDQEEAFTLCDRILMLHKGKIVQEGSPRQIYNFPINKWVASFVGDSNFFNCKNDRKILETMVLSAKLPDSACIYEHDLVIRPEDLTIHPADDDKHPVNGVLERVEFLGNVQYALILLKNRKKIKACIPKNLKLEPEQKLHTTCLGYHIFSESL